MNTFSVNSLKLLDKNIEDFINKYILHLEFLSSNQSSKRGERLHAMISYYLKNFDITKILNSLNQDEKEILEKTLTLDIFKEKEKFIKSEETFLIKCCKDDLIFYLSGRFDAIFKDGEKFIIYDWKSKNIPQNPRDDLQSIVYLYCASKIFNTKNIAIKYISLENQQITQTNFEDENAYLERIFNIVKKLPKKYLT